MIITKGHARRLIKANEVDYAGGTEEDSLVVDSRGDRYVVIARYDLHRVDHYKYVVPPKKGRPTSKKKE
jgi:hypothetical protein